MSLESTELKIGGQSFKGVYLAILLSLSTTLGSGVWLASSLYSRLEAVEGRRIPEVGQIVEKAALDKKELQSSIELITAELKANDVSQLQGKLATLGTNLKTILEQQQKLLLIDESVTELKLEIEAMKATVVKAELVSQKVSSFESKVSKVSKEIEDLWKGLDYLSNPLQ